MYGYYSNRGRWFDQFCRSPRKFICEKPTGGLSLFSRNFLHFFFWLLTSQLKLDTEKMWRKCNWLWTNEFRQDFFWQSGGTDAWIAEGTGCPDRWRVFAGRCYYFSNDSVTWFDARKQCQNFTSSDLVVIENQLENDFVQGTGGSMHLIL